MVAKWRESIILELSDEFAASGAAGPASARQLLRQDERLGAGAALALAAAERLAVPIMLCLEPAVREMASQQGLAVLPHSEAEGA